MMTKRRLANILAKHLKISPSIALRLLNTLSEMAAHEMLESGDEFHMTSIIGPLREEAGKRLDKLKENIPQ